MTLTHQSSSRKCVGRYSTLPARNLPCGRVEPKTEPHPRKILTKIRTAPRIRMTNKNRIVRRDSCPAYWTSRGRDRASRASPENLPKPVRPQPRRPPRKRLKKHRRKKRRRAVQKSTRPGRSSSAQLLDGVAKTNR